MLNINIEFGTTEVAMNTLFNLVYTFIFRNDLMYIN